VCDEFASECDEFAFFCSRAIANIRMYGGYDMREGAIEPKIMNYEMNSRIHFIISKVCQILTKI